MDFGKAIFVVVLDDLAAVSLFELVHSGRRDLIKMSGHNQDRRIGSPSLCKERERGREGEREGGGNDKYELDYDKLSMYIL